MTLFDYFKLTRRNPSGKFLKRQRNATSKAASVWKASDSLEFAPPVTEDLTETCHASISEDTDSSTHNNDSTRTTSTTSTTFNAQPQHTRFYSNHCLINFERQRRDVPPLKRSIELDRVARWYADNMAAKRKVKHSDPSKLHEHLQNLEYDILGENVAIGDTKGRYCMRKIHNTMMRDFGNYNNIMDQRFKEMGVATARDSKGQLYICQLFRG